MEGVHAKVNQALAGGRPLGPAGLGLELKWSAIESTLCRSHKDRNGILGYWDLTQIADLISILHIITDYRFTDKL